ncbi:putative MFS family arabinose efflux permease [Lentzea flaviverrucosa]|uniref:Predicted arabinose efflux permease, MFS family n=1 Tax=Lentzea flaviverrucosa TaxID=200379 RepID=A0A1H9XRC8_9PSEU|nr:putative MFS family arabinose efflux permease [Lentzea flaviverrucosa]SES48283.1 Predicted arabinose efflux permease, MFS family [Lentzea flaviverrucosa]
MSLVGDGVRVVALPLFAAASTRSPLAVSAVAVALTLPWLLVALPAGALVDRWRPRTVVLAAHWLRAGVTGLLALAVHTGHATVVVLCATAFVLTSAETFADSASQVLLVELAGPDDLEAANGRFVTVETIGMDLAGPLAAAVLFWWAPAACFALDALSFVVAAVLVSRVPDVAPDRSGSDLRGQLAEGARFLVRTSGLRSLVVAVAITALCAAAINAMLALYSIQVLGLAEPVVPFLVVCMAAGALLGARLSPLLAARWGAGRVMVAFLALLGAAFALFGLTPWLLVAVLACVLCGVASAGWNVLSATRRQRLTPGPMMGRVTSAYRVLAWGLSPLGAGLAGPLADATSLGTVYVVAGSIVGLTAILLARPLARG